jgi:hypothetical protein
VEMSWGTSGETWKNKKIWDQVGDIEVEMGSGICGRVKGADGRWFLLESVGSRMIWESNISGTEDGIAW